MPLKWVNLENVLVQAIEFKRSAYEEVRDAFREVAERLKREDL